MFSNCGIIQFEKNKISEEEAFEIAINAGAKDCLNLKIILK
jgi:transcriptional/translational regulatory protein YebC/TACO1